MSKYMSMETLKFLLFDVHNVEELFEYERFQDYDKDALNILLDSVKDLSDKKFYPFIRAMDEEPVIYKDGRIIAHESLGDMIKGYADLGLIGGVFDFEHGGMQMPSTFLSACNHIFESANNHSLGYMGLTTGSASLIATYANDALRETYVPRMITGEWTGTMCLTEPQAGSSLTDIVSTASPTGKDGEYKIKGQKIFISGGDHQFTDNVIHLVLARIDGAPTGTKGISLFVVPTNLPDENMADNDVIVAGDFQKLGQRGYATAHMVFGEHDNCKGYLVGEEHHGLNYMFKMMNEARIEVGITATSIASAAYYASLQYANERPQGRRIQSTGKKDANEEQTLIINHADVRRMLLLQKAVVEGALSVIVESSLQADKHHATKNDPAVSAKHHMLLEFLTPITKTYPSEMGQVSINNGLQILGGYGFCTDFVLQQYYRDIRICAIYEGTTGIQSMDLLGRKVTMKNGQALQLIMAEMQESIQAAMTFDELKPYANKLAEKLGVTQKVLGKLMGFAMKGDYERFLMDATAFMTMASTIVIGWQWLKMATKAKEALVSGNTTYAEDFYEGKIHTMKFYFKYEMPKVNTAAEILMDDEVLTIKKEKQLAF